MTILDFPDGGRDGVIRSIDTAHHPSSRRPSWHTGHGQPPSGDYQTAHERIIDVCRLLVDHADEIRYHDTAWDSVIESLQLRLQALDLLRNQGASVS